MGKLRAEHMAAFVKQAIDELGSVDILVANAGIASWHPFTELSEQAWRDVIDVNLTGTANALAAGSPSRGSAFVRRGDRRRR